MSLSIEDIETLQNSLDTIAVAIARRTAKIVSSFNDDSLSTHIIIAGNELAALRDATAIFATLAALQITAPTSDNANVPMP